VAERPLLAHSGRRPKSASAGSARLFGISKRGDRYLRTLLIHGARSALGRVRDKQDPRSLWLGKMRQRRHPNIVAVRLANKNARIVWSLLTSDSVYDVRLSVRAAWKSQEGKIPTERIDRSRLAIAAIGRRWWNGHSVASRTWCLDRHGFSQCLGVVVVEARENPSRLAAMVNHAP
jgi:hypothetical protein